MVASALTTFREHEEGIRTLLSAADVFTNHIVAAMRGEVPNPESLAGVVSGKQMTGFACLGMSYRDAEAKTLADNGRVRHIGQQIIMATYTAVEVYLADKFIEYFKARVHSDDSRAVERTTQRLGRVITRSLKDAREMYHDVLDIEIDCFDLRTITTTNRCSFRPKDSWSALLLIERTRNEIAHRGTSTYAVNNLTDAYYPFEFAHSWVDHFDANFDILLYHGWPTDLIKEYDVRRETKRARKRRVRANAAPETPKQ